MSNQSITIEEMREMLQDDSFKPSTYDWMQIETVFYHHPAVKNNPKENIVTLYKMGGMLIIRDLYQRAREIQELKMKLNVLESRAFSD